MHALIGADPGDSLLILQRSGIVNTTGDLLKNVFFFATGVQAMIMQSDFNIASTGARWKRSQGYWIRIAGFVSGLCSLVDLNVACRS